MRLHVRGNPVCRVATFEDDFLSAAPKSLRVLDAVPFESRSSDAQPTDRSNVSSLSASRSRKGSDDAIASTGTVAASTTKDPRRPRDPEVSQLERSRGPREGGGRGQGPESKRMARPANSAVLSRAAGGTTPRPGTDRVGNLETVT